MGRGKWVGAFTVILGIAALSALGCSEDPTLLPTADAMTHQVCHEHDNLGWHCHDLVHVADGSSEVSPQVPDGTVAPDSEKSTDCLETPGAFGCPCDSNDDCDFGYCIPSRKGVNICTQLCIESCPEGFDCQLVTLGSADPTFLCVE